MILKSLILRVHCWGGLGSQLFALAHAYELRKKFPNRKIMLLMHTGGVSERFFELDFLGDSDFEIRQVRDFKKSSFNQSAQIRRAQRIQNQITLITKKILYKTGFIASANTTKEFYGIRPWVISTRGHYSNRAISPSFFNFLLKHIRVNKNANSEKRFKLVIHYRMGDLLVLQSKSPSGADKLVYKVNSVLLHQPDPSIVVYSESLIEARKALVSAGLQREFVVSDLPTAQLIGQSLEADFFIGTNSKISLWITNLRRYLGLTEVTYLEGFDRQLYPFEQLKN
jgi:hypothetical protein